MKSFDNTINYYELLMIYEDTSKYKNYELPSGYHFDFYKDSDLEDWINIHISSEEFTSYENGFELFHKFFDSFTSELGKRCIFIVNDNNEKVGTATVSLLEKEEYGCLGAVDWLAIKKEYQGKGLSRPLISRVIKLAYELGHKKLILHTQTTSWLAVKLYLDQGFIPLNTDEEIGWKIIKRLTNHSQLSNFDNATDEELYDNRNIQIKKLLDNIYGENNYHYSVWYKFGLHDVYVFSNGKSYEYEYFDNNGKITLELKNTNDC